MSADSFGSFVEYNSAALFMSSSDWKWVPIYPLLLIALGIFFCLFVSILLTHIMSMKTIDKRELTLKLQLLISTIILLGVIFGAAFITYPSNFEVRTKEKVYEQLTYLIPYISSICGLISGLIIIALFTEYALLVIYQP